MPKRINNIYDEALTFSKIRAAYYRTAKRKKKTKDVIEFEMKLEDNVIQIYRDLKNETYKPGKYKEFKVYEPKERTIRCLPFYDRVIQQLYVHEYIMPYMLKKFISTSYACIPGKGVHTCVAKVQQFMRQATKKWDKPYFVKYDISKFFYSIDKKILYNILKKYYKDKKFLKLSRKFIGLPETEDSLKNMINNESSLGMKDEVGEGPTIEKGIPIGNYTSQYFANIYMNELDKYIKEKLRIQYYVRYMDDGLLMVENKKMAKEILEKIETYVNKELNMELNKKSGYFPVKQGCLFCGYRIYLNHKLIKRNNINRMKKRIKKWNKQWEKREYHFEYWRQSFYAWKGYVQIANSKNLIQKLENSMEFLVQGDRNFITFS